MPPAETHSPKDSSASNGKQVLSAEAPSPASSTAASQPQAPQLLDDRETIKALLAEARNTKTVLDEFDSAVKSGTFSGSQMLPLAKGLSFVTAVLAQHKAHIFNLQARLEKPQAPQHPPTENAE